MEGCCYDAPPSWQRGCFHAPIHPLVLICFNRTQKLLEDDQTRHTSGTAIYNGRVYGLPAGLTAIVLSRYFSLRSVRVCICTENHSTLISALAGIWG